MRLFCDSPHTSDPLVEQLRSEIGYLRGEVAEAREKEQKARDAYEFLVSARMKTELEYMRRDLSRPAAPPAPAGVPGPRPRGSNEPPWLDQSLHAGGHLDEDQAPLPENYDASEEELADATIEQAAQDREEERLLAAAGGR